MTAEISAGLECLDKKIVKGCISQKTFIPKRKELEITAVWIDLDSKWKEQETLSKFQGTLQPFFFFSRFTNFVDVAKVSMKPLISQASKKLKDSKNSNHDALMNYLIEFFDNSRRGVPRINKFVDKSPCNYYGPNHNRIHSFDDQTNPSPAPMPQLACIFSFEEHIVSLRRWKSEAERNKTGLVHEIQRAHSTWKLVTTTKSKPIPSFS